MNEKSLYLIIYAITTSVIAIRTYIKNEPLIYRALWTMTAVSAIFSVACKLDQGTFVGYGPQQNIWYDLQKTTWWSYILIVFCNMIAFEPFRLFNKKDELLQFGSSGKMKNFFVEFCLIYLFFSFVYYVTSIGIIKDVWTISDYGSLRIALFNNSENEGAAILTNNMVSSVALKACLRFRFLSVFIGLAMIKERQNTFLACVLIGDTFFLYYLNCMANAARGGLIIFMIILGMIGLMYYPYLSAKNKRRVFVGSSIIMAVVLMFFISVTISRLATNRSGGILFFRNISFYLGHAPIEFSKITGSLDHFAWGRIIGGRIANHFLGTSYSWGNIAVDIGYPPIGSLFVTYLGFLYTDFGAAGCVIFTVLWSTFTCGVIKRRHNSISTIFFLLYYLSFFVMGVFTVGRLEFVAVITTYVMYFIIRFIERTPTLSRLFTSISFISNRKNNRAFMIGDNNARN